MTEGLFPVVILAGGLASRLRPITENIPKSMVEIEGEPFIAHQLRLLAKRGVTRVIICAGYLGEKIEQFVGNGEKFGISVEFSYDGPHLLGTAGAIKKALPLLGEFFFVLYGDSYLPCDYRKVQQAFIESKRMALMTVFQNEGRWDKSNVEFVDGQILVYDKIHPTPAMRHIDYGLGLFRKETFHLVPPNQPYDLAKLYQELIHRGEVAGFLVEERFFEIGSFEGIEEFRIFLSRSDE